MIAKQNSPALFTGDQDIPLSFGGKKETGAAIVIDTYTIGIGNFLKQKTRIMAFLKAFATDAYGT